VGHAPDLEEQFVRQAPDLVARLGERDEPARSVGVSRN
jgi:hypothetical protein